MSHLAIITYKNQKDKQISFTKKSLLLQTYRDFEWLIINAEEIIDIQDYDYYLFLRPGEYLSSKDTLQIVFEQENGEDIVFGNAYIKRFFHHKHEVGPTRDDISLFHMMENPIPLSATFIKKTLFEKTTLSSEFTDPSHWLEFLLSRFFLNNCSLKYINSIISYSKESDYRNMFNIDKHRQEEIIQTIMPRLVNHENRLYSQSETNEALRFFYFLQNNKIALSLYNKFIKPQGGLDA